MRKFLAKHAATTTGTLSCFDRLLFKAKRSRCRSPGTPIRRCSSATNVRRDPVQAEAAERRDAYLRRQRGTTPPIPTIGSKKP
jgi:hypothetical protein